MHLKKSAIPLAFVSLILLVTLARAQLIQKDPPGPEAIAELGAAPATQPAGPAWTMSVLRDQELSEVPNYLYVTAKTPMNDMAKVPFKELVDKVARTMEDNKIAPAGPCIMCYNGVTEDMTKEIEITIGFQVGPSVKPVGGCQTKSLPAFKCAATTFSGAVTHMSEAYPAIYGAFFQSGRIPAGEGREYYLYWDEKNPDNDVILISIGKK